MAERAVVWTQTAAKQRRETLKYWTERNRSTKYAETLINLISNRLSIIVKSPETFKSTTYPGTKISAMGHFSILYKYSADQITITAFWDNRQDPKKLLKSILP